MGGPVNKWLQVGILGWLVIQFVIALSHGLPWAISWVALNAVVIGVVVLAVFALRVTYRKVRN